MKISRRGLFIAGAAAGAAAGQAGAPAPPRPVPGRRFTGAALEQIAFPLGGIGTGTVSLGGYGNLRDWEIYNRPHKGSITPFTFVALRLEGGGLKKPLVRVVQRQPHPPFTGRDGVPRDTGLGLPRFREAAFTGAYPFAEIAFTDARLPVEVSLEAFNPMIPLDTDESSLPVAIFTYRVRSRAASKIDAALAFSLMNTVGFDGVTALRNRNAAFFGQNTGEFRREPDLCGLLLASRKYPQDSARYGSLAVLAPAGDVSYRLQWERGSHFDEFQKWWDEFHDRGRFPSADAPPSADGTTEYTTLASHFSLGPNESKDLTFVLAWHFPNGENYWTRD